MNTTTISKWVIDNNGTPKWVTETTNAVIVIDEVIAGFFINERKQANQIAKQILNGELK
jgi:hypothetical protein